MPRDIIITPASGLVDFKDDSGTIDAKIQIDLVGNLTISNSGGELTIGDGTSNVFIGNGVSSSDIIFEQSGKIRSLTNRTLTLGQGDSFVTSASPFGFLSPNGTKQITARMLNTDVLSFQGGAGELLSISGSLTGTIFTVNDVSGIPSIEVIDTGLVKLAQYSGNVVIGSATDLGQKFQVAGTAALGTNLANYLTVTGATPGNVVSITTAGSDANIGLTITTKGTGNIILDTGTSTGDIEIKPGSSNFRLYDDNSSHYYRFVTGDRTANYDITLPAGNVTLTAGTTVVDTRSINTTAPLSGGGNLSADRTFSLAAGYGDTLNPFGSKTANFFLAAPNGAAGVPTFRAIVAADIPTLNQNTTGTAANVTGTVAVANGGTGATTAAAARTNLGANTVGSNVFTLTNPSAITFPRFNADNTVSALNAADFRTAIGAGTSSTVGTVTSVTGTGTVSGITLSGTVSTSGNLTLGGTLAVTAANFASQTANQVLAAPNGAAGVPTFRAIVAADIPTLNQNTTGSAATLTTARTINGTSFNGSANITTANWGTARTLTIGSTGKSVDGSANVSWSLAELGAQAALGFTPVQQGGGTNQGTNKVYIGWGTGGDLHLQVDATNFGTSWPINITKNAATATTATNLSGGSVSATTGTFSSGVTASSFYAVDVSANAGGEVGGGLHIRNPSKTGAITSDWALWNMTGGYGNRLAFWRYNADGGNPGAFFNLYDAGFATCEDMRVGVLYKNGDTSYSHGFSDSHRFQTPGGWIDIGAKNTGTCHIYTDRPSFYFNQLLLFNGKRVLNEDEWMGSKYFGSDGAIYGTRFYDANNSTYFCDPAGTSEFVELRIGNGDYSYIQMEDDNSPNGLKYIHCNGNSIGFLSGQGNWILNVGNGGDVFAGANVYGHIFYDGSDTSWYCNPNSTSRFNDLNTQSFYNYSDDRLKIRLGNIDNALNKVKQLNGFLYRPSPEGFRAQLQDRVKPALSAQELRKVLPEAVHDDGSYLSIDYTTVVPLLVEAIKELSQELEFLRSQI